MMPKYVVIRKDNDTNFFFLFFETNMKKDNTSMLFNGEVIKELISFPLIKVNAHSFFSVSLLEMAS